MSSLAQLQVQNGYWEAEATQTWWRKADWEQKRQKQAATHDTYRVTNQQRMAAMESSWVDWNVKGPAGF